MEEVCSSFRDIEVQRLRQTERTETGIERVTGRERLGESKRETKIHKEERQTDRKMESCSV